MKQTNSKPIRFPEFQERFRKIQGAQNDTSFSKKIGITRQSVGFYKNGDRVPDALILRTIAEKTNVSADYLLGLSDIKSKSPDIKMIGNYTGLSEKAIYMLHHLTAHAKNGDAHSNYSAILHFLNHALESESESMCKNGEG